MGRRASGGETPRGGATLRLLAATAVLVLVAFAPASAAAQQSVQEDNAVRQIARQLQCPVCVGQTVAESNSGLAEDMRNVIRTKLREGQTDQQIIDAFVAAYGESVLSDPPKRGIGLGVWVAPVVLLLLGVSLLVVLTRRWSRRAGAALRAPSVALPRQALVVDELQRYREEYGR